MNHAIEPRCPYFGTCGGCTLQTMDYASQIEQKTAALRDALYSGAGVFGLFLSDKFSHVTLVEQNMASLAWAEVNLRGKPHTSFAESGKKWLAGGGSKQHFDAVIADPPRSGLESEVCAWLGRTKPASLRYVSCNPTALAHDAIALVRAGYALERLYLFDFYPQTRHIEALAWFEA